MQNECLLYALFFSLRYGRGTHVGKNMCTVSISLGINKGCILSAFFVFIHDAGWKERRREGRMGALKRLEDKRHLDGLKCLSIRWRNHKYVYMLLKIEEICGKRLLTRN